MKCIQEKVFFGVTKDQETRDIGMAVLENDVWILVHENGTATGSDGKRYARVSREVASRPIYANELLQYFCTSVEDFNKEPPESYPTPDTDLVSLGWTTDADKPIVIPITEQT